MKEWQKLCNIASRLSFDPHDIASQLDGRGRYSVELDEEFPLLIKLFRYTSKQHTRARRGMTDWNCSCPSMVWRDFAWAIVLLAGKWFLEQLWQEPESSGRCSR